MITCFCPADERNIQKGIMSALRTTEAFPDAEKFAAFDVPCPELEEYCRKNGWRLEYPAGGKPPRMRELLRQCVLKTAADVIWTIEHDVLIDPTAREKVMAYMGKYKGLGACECYSLDRHGRPTAPCRTKGLLPFRKDAGLFHVVPYGSLNCVAWRGDVLRAINWTKVPEYPRTDRGVFRQVVKNGWHYVVTKEATCCHLHGYARRAFDGERRIPTKSRPLSIAIILPVRNEGARAVNTVRAMRKAIGADTILRFAVIDDASTDGCCAIFKPAKDIVMVRNEAALGEAHARNRGFEMIPDADVYITFDAHMEPITGNGVELLARAALDTGGLCCGTTFKLIDGTNPNDSGTDFPRNGGRFDWRPICIDPKKPAGLRQEWSYKRELPLQPITTLLGASYAMTRATRGRLGGWEDTEGLYGYGEQALCIKARFLGIPVYCVTEANFKHFFRVNRPYPMSGEYYWYNYVYCNRIIWREDIFWSVFWPVVTRTNNYMQHVNQATRLEELCKHPEAIRRNSEFGMAKKRSDEEVLAWLDIKLGVSDGTN
ncbi:MAG: glycosyltransferase [Candidatus Atribacteria bacterium]|nr:glycosyltransferase [Candidatus Atribacteria bacterium]